MDFFSPRTLQKSTLGRCTTGHVAAEDHWGQGAGHVRSGSINPKIVGFDVCIYIIHTNVINCIYLDHYRTWNVNQSKHPDLIYKHVDPWIYASKYVSFISLCSKIIQKSALFQLCPSVCTECTTNTSGQK